MSKDDIDRAVKDAEKFADEDKKRRDEIDIAQRGRPGGLPDREDDLRTRRQDRRRRQERARGEERTR
jgi:hypothetical protein